MVLSRRQFSLLLSGACAARASSDESFQVFTEHPRLFLTRQRLRLLRRERERNSARWQQFEAFLAGGARMPEPGLALALYHQVAGDAGAGRRAVEWALKPAADLRQSALVYDWCQEALDEAASAALGAKLRRGIEERARNGVGEARTRALAAVAVVEREPKLSEAELRRVVEQWWRGQVAPALKSGRAIVDRREFYALFELLHVVRDNIMIELREPLAAFFRDLPLYDLMSYYPASYPAAENEYRIPAVKGGQPDLEYAIRSRAAELAMVAYDTNAVEHQWVQGWLMHDRFLLRSPAGIPYEFLWANPYQPGLSYFLLPLLFHDDRLGRLFARSGWEDAAFWLGYFDGQLQTFSEGEPRIVEVSPRTEPVWFGETAVFPRPAPARFQVDREAKLLFVVGLEPAAVYEVEVDDQEMREERSDPGGILAMRFDQGFQGGVRLKRRTG
jgi:hypothetical protein